MRYVRRATASPTSLTRSDARPTSWTSLAEELRKKRILFVAGGVATAPVYPQVKWLHEQGVQADVIIGAKTKDIFTYVDEMRTVGNAHSAHRRRLGRLPRHG